MKFIFDQDIGSPQIAGFLFGPLVFHIYNYLMKSVMELQFYVLKNVDYNIFKDYSFRSKYIDHLREYYYAGGMPEVVQTYVRLQGAGLDDQSAAVSYCKTPKVFRLTAFADDCFLDIIYSKKFPAIRLYSADSRKS